MNTVLSHCNNKMCNLLYLAFPFLLEWTNKAVFIKCTKAPILNRLGFKKHSVYLTFLKEIF